jgi:hypothetical protein
MTTLERKQNIKAYAEGHKLLVKALKKFPRKMWKWKPAPHKWSIHEILIHLADSETNAYLRARRFLAEPGQPVMAYDQDVWAQKLNYHAQDPKEALALVGLVRKMTYTLIRNLPEDAWSARCVHPEHDNYSFDRWLEIYSRHVHGHIAQIERNFDAWRAIKKRR